MYLELKDATDNGQRVATVTNNNKSSKKQGKQTGKMPFAHSLQNQVFQTNRVIGRLHRRCRSAGETDSFRASAIVCALPAPGRAPALLRRQNRQFIEAAELIVDHLHADTAERLAFRLEDVIDDTAVHLLDKSVCPTVGRVGGVVLL